MKPVFAIAAAGIAIGTAIAPMPVIRAIATVASLGAARLEYKAYTSVAAIASIASTLENRRLQRSIDTQLKTTGAYKNTSAGKPSAP